MTRHAVVSLLMDYLVLMDDVGYVLDDEQVFLFLVRQFVVGSYVKVDKLLLLELLEMSAVFPFLLRRSLVTHDQHGEHPSPVLHLGELFHRLLIQSIDAGTCGLQSETVQFQSDAVCTGDAGSLMRL